MARVGDVYERRAVHATHDRDLMTVLRVVVTPDVAQLHTALAAHRRDRQERHQVDLIAVENRDFAAGALAVRPGERRERRDIADQVSRDRPGAAGAAAVQRDATFTVVLVGRGDRDQRSGAGDLGAEPIARGRLLRSELRGAREYRRVARDPEHAALEAVRAIGADPQLISRFDKRDSVARAKAAVERERPADRTPAAARRIADIEPHRTGTTIVHRPDERGVGPQNQCAPEASIPTGDWARSDDLVHLPTTGRIAIEDVHGAVARISAEIPDHDPRA